MLKNCVKRKPWLPSVGENSSNAFEVTTKLGNRTDSQPVSDQKVIKAVTLEFGGGGGVHAQGNEQRLLPTKIP